MGIKVAYLGGAGELEADPLIAEGVPPPGPPGKEPLRGIPLIGGGAMRDANGSLLGGGLPPPPPPMGPGGPPPGIGGVAIPPPICHAITPIHTHKQSSDNNNIP